MTCEPVVSLQKLANSSVCESYVVVWTDQSYLNAEMLSATAVLTAPPGQIVSHAIDLC